MKIIIGIPTLNRADLLERCVRKLLCQADQFDKLYIVDNGNQQIPYEGSSPQIEVIKNPDNAGVSKSWNQMIDRAFNKDKADWLILLNDDIAFNEKQLAISVIPLLKYNADKWVLVSPFFWSSIAISKHFVKPMEYEPRKWFDEKLFPGYYGDNDMQWRIENTDPTKIMFQVSALTPEVCDNSMTLRKDVTLRRGIAESGSYYVQKWGDGPGLEKYKRPFNK